MKFQRLLCISSTSLYNCSQPSGSMGSACEDSTNTKPIIFRRNFASGLNLQRLFLAISRQHMPCSHTVCNLKMTHIGYGQMLCQFLQLFNFFQMCKLMGHDEIMIHICCV